MRKEIRKDCRKKTWEKPVLSILDSKKTFSGEFADTEAYTGNLS